MAVGCRTRVVRFRRTDSSYVYCVPSSLQSKTEGRNFDSVKIIPSLSLNLGD